MKATNTDQVKTEEFRMDFHLEVMAWLSSRVREMGVDGIVITDQSIGHEIDIQNDYLGNSIGILGDNESEVNEELTSLYHQVAEDAERELEERTKAVLAIGTGHQVIVWRGPSGWMYCHEYTTADGLSFESEDRGPFDACSAAIEDAEEEAAAETA